MSEPELPELSDLPADILERVVAVAEMVVSADADALVACGAVADHDAAQSVFDVSRDYPATLLAPSVDEMIAESLVYESQFPEYWIELQVPLHSVQEGRSDLELRVHLGPGERPRILLWDLLVP